MVDNCASIVAAQRRRHPMLDWRVADVRNLPFEAESFDVLLDKGLLDNLFCYADAEAAVAAFRLEARRVLAPDGRLVVFSSHDAQTNEAALTNGGDGLWATAVAPMWNPRFPRIDIEYYHVAARAGTSVTKRRRDVRSPRRSPSA